MFGFSPPDLLANYSVQKALRKAVLASILASLPSRWQRGTVLHSFRLLYKRSVFLLFVVVFANEQHIHCQCSVLSFKTQCLSFAVRSPPPHALLHREYLLLTPRGIGFLYLRARAQVNVNRIDAELRVHD